MRVYGLNDFQACAENPFYDLYIKCEVECNKLSSTTFAGHAMIELVSNFFAVNSEKLCPDVVFVRRLLIKEARNSRWKFATVTTKLNKFCALLHHII